MQPTSVVVHPLVLLSVVDHYNRSAAETKRRVLGVLLGSSWKGQVDVTNSYAVPFEEDPRNPDIWFVDHNYHENMFAMFKKVNAREQVVGWYSTGPKLKESDIKIHELWKKYCPHPTLVIIDVAPSTLGLPTKGYIAIEEVREDGTSEMAFKHIPAEIGALEAEEVGVEHLLRDIKDTTVSTLATEVNRKLAALKNLVARLKEMQKYLSLVAENKLPINHTIINNFQDIFNLLPNLDLEEVVKSFAVKTNDLMLVIYVASLIRSVIALHNLINNKIKNRDEELKMIAKEREAEEKEIKDAKEKEEVKKLIEDIKAKAKGKEEDK
eukprot:TRINITY_DN6173_c0_g1_i1.p1 TRINITY_DN6173_c0_g1~~TRINITY_DN6173_c0_g1_i1.p1  ORF type:complete len:324 (+),score=37.40 TRINITY_DN6173_c0_g1_i1:20-991(+)